jgi:glycosyltransferase involved in cell wall biosynthesis
MVTSSTVSLIIAAYNRGIKIAPTVDSVLAQTVVPNEILVVDDGSTDGTGDWVRAHYPQVRVVTKVNGGTSAARNWGAEAAQSQILMFLDHDDTLMPHAVATLLDLFRTYPEARAVFADHAYVNLVSKVQFGDHHTEQPAFARMRAIPFQRRVGPTRLYGRAMYYALLHGNLLQQPWAIDRATFLKLSGFASEIRYCEDWDLYMRVARAVPLAVTDQVISAHNIEGSNLHLAPGQKEMHQKVIRRQLNFRRWNDPRATLILRRRLAIYLKSKGDLARATRPRTAWACYVRSLVLWPFDHVVAARTLLWLPALVSRGETSKSEFHPE